MRRFFAVLLALTICQTAWGENRLIRTECEGGVCRRVFVGSSFENDVIAKVNAERRSRGLRPLKISEKLMTVARGWSGVQARQRRMYHSNNGFGENVAYGQPTPDAVMRDWMNSPGHRRNILSPSYSEIGVGAVQNGRSIYWTQSFK
jgi:uncharacterized protein YkwD